MLHRRARARARAGRGARHDRARLVPACARGVTRSRRSALRLAADPTGCPAATVASRSSPTSCCSASTCPTDAPRRARERCARGRCAALHRLLAGGPSGGRAAGADPRRAVARWRSSPRARRLWMSWPPYVWTATWWTSCRRSRAPSSPSPRPASHDRHQVLRRRAEAAVGGFVELRVEVEDVLTQLVVAALLLEGCLGHHGRAQDALVPLDPGLDRLTLEVDRSKLEGELRRRARTARGRGSLHPTSPAARSPGGAAADRERRRGTCVRSCPFGVHAAPRSCPPGERRGQAGGDLVARREHHAEARRHAVERSVGERQLLGVSLDELDLDARCRGTLALLVEQLRRQVETGDLPA